MGREKALVAHTVDGKNGGDFAKGGILGVERAQHHGQESRLPVVAVEYMRHPQNLGSFKDRAREQSEALGVVGIVAGWPSVERFAVKIRRIVHEIKSNSG